MNKTNNKVWKICPEFPFIETSPYGNVRTIDRVVSTKRGPYFIKGRVLKQSLNYKGYLIVHFHVNGKQVHKSVHRLVAETFILNPNNLPQVNHKNCDRTDNRVDNLEWCDNSYNQRYREKYGVSQTESQGYPSLAVNLETREAYRFQSQNEAGRFLGADPSTINKVIKGKYSQTHGYWFANINNNVMEAVRAKFGDSMANKVKELMKDKESE